MQLETLRAPPFRLIASLPPMGMALCSVSRLLSPLSCVSIHKYFSLYARPCANWTHSTQGPSRNVKGQAEQEVCVLFDGGHFESVFEYVSRVKFGVGDG